jgi:hypothetical protein
METESHAVALELVAFGASDIVALTGLPSETIRSWRRKGFVDMPGRGRAKHVGDLVAYALLKDLAGMMGGPGVAAPVAAKFAPLVLWRVLRDARAWRDDSLDVPADERAALALRALGQTPPPPELAYGFHNGETTLAAPSLEAGRAYFAQSRASGLLITIDFDASAAGFLARAAGRSFAAIIEATPAEAALLQAQTPERKTLQ